RQDYVLNLYETASPSCTIHLTTAAPRPVASHVITVWRVAWRRIDADDFLTIGKMTWIEDENFAIDFSDKGNDITNWNLVIDKVSPEYAGIYECQVTSKLGYNKLVKLNVVGPPITDPGRGLVAHSAESSTTRENTPFQGPVTRCGVPNGHGCLISITGKRYVDIGEEIHLVCNVSGGSRIPEDIDWFKDGDMIDSFKYPRVLIAKYQSIRDRAFISELKIDRARLRDTGEYVCRSSRDHIVNMKVTVLRAASPNFRRGRTFY
ncbi:hypothetical protein BaRGS_00024239, partial [Batillaria attramentaria]